MLTLESCEVNIVGASSLADEFKEFNGVAW